MNALAFAALSRPSQAAAERKAPDPTTVPARGRKDRGRCRKDARRRRNCRSKGGHHPVPWLTPLPRSRMARRRRLKARGSFIRLVPDVPIAAPHVTTFLSVSSVAVSPNRPGFTGRSSRSGRNARSSEAKSAIARADAGIACAGPTRKEVAHPSSVHSFASRLFGESALERECRCNRPPTPSHTRRRLLVRSHPIVTCCRFSFSIFREKGRFQ